ncbi:MAG: hypothetical protein Q6363_002270 [Candidatus Njordarchaeota archaeon]
MAEGKQDIAGLLENIRSRVKEEAMRLILKEAALKIVKYLGLMNKQFKTYRAEGVVVTEELEGGGEATIMVAFRPPEWIEIRTLLISTKEMSMELMRECNVLETLFRLSADFAELSFCMDESGNIYAKQNILVGALSFDVFKEEYNAVYLSALIFRKEILPRLKKCVRNYHEIRDAYSSIT